MQQVTSSSDIWSVGCLIVELLTGSPPYYDLITMAAMFRIVQVGAGPCVARCGTRAHQDAAFVYM